MPRLEATITALALGAAILLGGADVRADGRPRGHHGSRFGHHGFRFQGHTGHGYHSIRIPRYHFGPIWRHHGLGEGGYCDAEGVRRYHGLGDGPCYGAAAPRYWWIDPPAYEPAPPAAPPPPRSAPPAAPRPQFPAPDETSFARTNRAWSLLRDGQPRPARRDFAVLALRTSEDVIPRVGFALASAALGDDRTAIWAMRRAFEMDALAVGDLPVDDALAARVRALIWRYAGRGDDPEALFMVAALAFLAGDEELAVSAIGEAIERGDAAPSTHALGDLLEAGPPAPEELERRTPEVPPTEGRGLQT